MNGNVTETENERDDKKVAKRSRSRPEGSAKAQSIGMAGAALAKGSSEAIPRRKLRTAQEKAHILDEIQKLVEAGRSVRTVVRQFGISEQTYYHWKKAPAREIRTNEMLELIELEAENARLKKLLAERLRQENAEMKKKLGI